MASELKKPGNAGPRPGCRKALRAFGLSILAMVIIVVAIICSINTWLGKYTHHDESVRVPLVIGMSADEAMEAIAGAGLTPMIIDSVYSNAAPGSVIEQLPEGNLPVKLDRIVYLTINARSRQMMVLPDLHDWSSRQAKSRLVEAGFVVDSIKYEPYEYDDLVLSITSDGQTLVPGRKYPVRTHMVLHVGTTREMFDEDEFGDDDDTVGFETDSEDEAAAADYLME